MLRIPYPLEHWALALIKGEKTQLIQSWASADKQKAISNIIFEFNLIDWHLNSKF